MSLNDIQVTRELVNNDAEAAILIKDAVANIIDGGNSVRVINYEIVGFEGTIIILCKMNELCKVFNKQLVMYYGPDGICCYTTNITMYFDDETCIRIMKYVDAETMGLEDCSDEIAKLELLVDVLTDVAMAIQIVDGELRYEGLG